MIAVAAASAGLGILRWRSETALRRALDPDGEFHEARINGVIALRDSVLADEAED